MWNGKEWVTLARGVSFNEIVEAGKAVTFPQQTWQWGQQTTAGQTYYTSLSI
jgi:hypothetical protein